MYNKRTCFTREESENQPCLLKNMGIPFLDFNTGKDFKNTMHSQENKQTAHRTNQFKVLTQDTNDKVHIIIFMQIYAG